MKLAVGIATVGRAQLVQRNLENLAKQLRPPDKVFISTVEDDETILLELQHYSFPVDVLVGPRGLTLQRNLILDQSSDYDVIVFFDDDFFPDARYLKLVEAFFTSFPEIAICTNQPDLDGASGAGISIAAAMDCLDRLAGQSISMNCADWVGMISETFGGYGCNMSINLTIPPVRDVRFDANLPNYGWLEDMDFSRRLAPYGAVRQFDLLHGVHLGTKSAKASGVLLGYSQIANPLYLLRKGTLPAKLALNFVLRSLLMNTLRLVKPEPWIDRRGRLQGNGYALVDLVAGRLHPERILNL